MPKNIKHCQIEQKVIFKDNNSGLFASRSQVVSRSNYYERFWQKVIQNIDPGVNRVPDKPDYRWLAYSQLGENPQILFEGRDPYKVFKNNPVRAISDDSCKMLIKEQNEIVKLWIKQFNKTLPRTSSTIKFGDIKIDLIKVFDELKDLDQKYSRAKDTLLYLENFIKDNRDEDSIIELSDSGYEADANLNSNIIAVESIRNDSNAILEKGDSQPIIDQSKEIISIEDSLVLDLDHQQVLSLKEMDVVVNLSKTIEPQPSSNIIDNSIIQKSAFDSQSENEDLQCQSKNGETKESKSDKMMQEISNSKMKLTSIDKKRTNKDNFKMNEENNSMQLTSQQAIILLNHDIAWNDQLKAYMLKSFSKINEQVSRFKTSEVPNEEEIKVVEPSNASNEEKNQYKKTKKYNNSSNLNSKKLKSIIKSKQYQIAQSIVKGAKIDYTSLIQMNKKMIKKRLNKDKNKT